MTKKQVLGIDIGGTHTVCGVVNEAGEILYKRQISSKGYSTPYDFVKAIHTILVQDEAFQQFTISAIV
jgi:Transcriptional regulator/sugar kinase